MQSSLALIHINPYALFCMFKCVRGASKLLRVRRFVLIAELAVPRPEKGKLPLKNLRRDKCISLDNSPSGTPTMALLKYASDSGKIAECL